MSDFLSDLRDRVTSTWETIHDRLTGVRSGRDESFFDSRYVPWIAAILVVMLLMFPFSSDCAS